MKKRKRVRYRRNMYQIQNTPLSLRLCTWSSTFPLIKTTCIYETFVGHSPHKMFCRILLSKYIISINSAITVIILMTIQIVFFFRFTSSTPSCPTGRRHLCLNDWSHHSVGNHSTAITRCCCRSRVMLADGLSTTTESNGTTTPSARIPQSTVHESGRGVRTNTRLFVISLAYLIRFCKNNEECGRRKDVRNDFFLNQIGAYFKERNKKKFTEN